MMLEICKEFQEFIKIQGLAIYNNADKITNNVSNL